MKLQKKQRKCEKYVTANGKELNNALLREIDRKMNAHLESWEKMEKVEVRHIEIEKVK